jgi:hypothetical protein
MDDTTAEVPVDPSQVFQLYDSTHAPVETCFGTTEDSKSTLKALNRAAKCWKTFVAQLTPEFVTLHGDDVINDQFEYNVVLSHDFITFYMTSRDAPNKHHIGEATNFLQRRLRDKRGRLRNTPEGIVSGDHWVKQKKKQFTKAIVKQHNANLSKDVQAHLDNQIPRKKELELIDRCYDTLVLPHTSFHAQSNVACGFTYSGQGGTRGSDNRLLYLSHGFIRNMEHLGEGVDVDHFIHVEGKTIKNGRYEYKAFASHLNPRLDASAHFGLNLLLRFNHEQEPFPNFLDPADYARRPVFRSVVNYNTAYPSNTMQANWSAMFQGVGIVCPKVTHQPRVQTQQRLSDKGCSTQNIERAIGYAIDGQKMNDNQRTSYLNCPPVQFVAGAADGDPNDPRTFSAGWDVEIFPNEIYDLVPYLYFAISRVESRYNACRSSKEREAECLNQALGALKAMERRIHSAVKLLASYFQDDRNLLLPDIPAIFLTWRSPILTHPFFKSTSFHTIVQRVQEGQRRESMLLDELPSLTQCNWVKREVTQVLLPKIQSSQQVILSMLQGQRSLLHDSHDQRLTLQEQQQTIDRLSCQLSLVMDHFGIENGSSVSSDSSSSTTPINPSSANDVQPNDNLPASYVGEEISPKKRSYQLVQNKPFSSSNVTAADYWREWKSGVNGNPSLESLEASSTSWRSDKRFKREDGSYGTAIKVAWSKQLPLYKAITYLIDTHQLGDDVAIERVQNILNANKYKKSGKADLSKCKPFLVAIYEPEI